MTFGKFICWWKKKHLRGVRCAGDPPGYRSFRCPRCNRRTVYKNGEVMK